MEMGGFVRWYFWRETECKCEICKDKKTFEVFDQLVMISRCEEREEAANCKSENMRDVTTEDGVISKKIKRIFQRVREIIDEDQE